MANKKGMHIGKLLLKLVVLVPTVFSLLSNVASLLRIEARLAGKSIVTIITLTLLSFVLLFSTWGCILVMLFIYLTSLHLSMLLSIFALILLNIFLLIIICFSIKSAKRNLSFPETSHQLKKITKINFDS